VGRAFIVGQERLVVVDEKELNTLYPGVTPPTEDYIASITVKVADLANTRWFLEKAGIEMTSAGTDRIWVSPRYAGGVILAFCANS
jgi:hypothetical protein